MNTVTHLVVASALLSRKGASRLNLAVVSGAIAPDLSMFVFFAWARWRGLDTAQTWNVAYWQEPWQTLSAISNSFPIAIALLVWGMVRRRTVMIGFALALLVHALLDLPFHADDAHRHFWPLTNWRFNSPLSYWDPNYHGGVVGWFELCLFLAASGLIWQRYRALWIRSLVTIGAALMISLTVALTLAPPDFGST